jgi:hypothetical protein
MAIDQVGANFPVLEYIEVLNKYKTKLKSKRLQFTRSFLPGGKL